MIYDKGGENIIKVYSIKDMLGMGPGPTSDVLDVILDEVRENLLDETEGQIIIEVGEMTEAAYLQMPEFEGY